MFGKLPYVNPLESRKERLIAESELNRDQLFDDWQSMTHGVHDLAHRVKIVGAWASSAMVLVAGVSALRRGPRAAGAAKSSWFQKILHAARLASTIWLASRARGPREEPK